MQQELNYVVIPCPFGCECRLRFPKASHNLLVTCPKCKQTFTWTPFGIVYDERFSTNRRKHGRGLGRWRRVISALSLLLLGGAAVTLFIHSAVDKTLQYGTLEMHIDRPATAGGEAPLRQPARTAHRPPSGAYIEPPHLTQGRSTLRIENGTDHDAVVNLVKQQGDTKTVARCVYVRSREEVLLEGIEPGEYLLAWCSGANWDSSSQQFTDLLGCFMADRLLEFTESEIQEDNRIRYYYTERYVSLHTVLGGNIGTQSITWDSFQSLQ